MEGGLPRVSGRRPGVKTDWWEVGRGLGTAVQRPSGWGAGWPRVGVQRWAVRGVGVWGFQVRKGAAGGWGGWLQGRVAEAWDKAVGPVPSGLLTCGGLRPPHWPRGRQGWSGVWGCPHRAVRRSRVSRGRWAKKVGWVHRRLEGEGLTPGGGGECGWQGKHLGGGVKAGSQIGWGWSWRAHDFWLGGVRSALKEGAPGGSRGSGMPETPTWRQLRAAVGPAPVLERPGWTGRPRETAPTSRRQGPRQMAIGSGGGTRAR